MSRNKEIHVLQGRTAGFITRLLAYMMDVAILAGVIAVGGWLAVLADGVLVAMGVDPRVDLATIFVFMIPFIIGSYFVFFWALTGRTIGKWFMGLKVIGRGGKTISVRQAFFRLIGYGVSAIVFWMGYLWVLVDNERQAWHDHMATTWVVYDYQRRSGGQIYEEFQTRAEGSSR
jgi:uncharacterized RDD family membrane protein YckC